MKIDKVQKIIADTVEVVFKDGRVLIGFVSGETSQAFALTYAQAKAFYHKLRDADYQADLAHE